MSFTEQDRELAKAAIVEGWNGCKLTMANRFQTDRPCDCDIGAIDGCKSRVDALARVIAFVRGLNGK